MELRPLDLRSPLDLIPFELWRLIASYLDYISLKHFSCSHPCFLAAAEDHPPVKIRRRYFVSSVPIRPQKSVSLHGTIVAFDFLPRGTFGVLLAFVNEYRKRDMHLALSNIHGVILQTIFVFSESISLLSQADLKYIRAQKCFAVTTRVNEIDIVTHSGNLLRKVSLNQLDIVQSFSIDPHQNLLVLLEDRIAHFSVGNYEDRKDILFPSCPLTLEGIATKLYDQWIFCSDFSSKTIFAVKRSSNCSIVISSYRLEEASAVRGIDVDEGGNIFVCVLDKEPAKGHIEVSVPPLLPFQEFFC